MSTDPFTEAARAEAESWIGMDLDDHDNFVSGAEWGREQALAQEPTDEMVERAKRELFDTEGLYVSRPVMRDVLTAALSAARAARRDEEKRNA